MSKKKKEQLQYEFTLPLFAKLDANVAGKELERIRKKYGVLNPKDVVNESANENSPLHSIFDWDDTTAAYKYRQQQARNLINHIKVIVVNKEIKTSIRAYVNVKPDLTKDTRVYMPTLEAIVNDDAYQDLLQQSKEDMETFITKYSQIQELNPVKAEMLKAMSVI